MSKHHTTVAPDEAAKMFQLDLKSRSLAALLAWLVPGLGHLYQGRTAKGLLFMICIGTTFAFGYYVGDGRVVYASTERFTSPNRETGGSKMMRLLGAHWKIALQSGIGSAALPAIIERQRALSGKPPLFGEAFRPPRPEGVGKAPTTRDSAGELVYHPDELAKWQYELGFNYELGVVYTVVAGLLNVLAIYDAHSGPLIIRREDPDGEDKKGGAKDGAEPDGEGADA